MQKKSIKNLRKIKIKDNGEPLVDLKKYCPNIIIGLEQRRLKKEKAIYIRKSVATMLKRAEKSLPEGFRLKIRDGWRPLSEQKYYYEKLYRNLKKKNPDWSKARLRRETNKWVSPADSTGGHPTGGAIDLSVCYASGREWAMRSKKEKFSKRVLKNRKFLKTIMENVGFINYPLEWWHFSYGDSGWAQGTGRKTAIYGKITHF